MNTTLAELCSDIWQQIFEYLNPIELFYSLVHVTTAANEVLFNRGHHLQLRKLIIDADTDTLPEKLPLNEIVSLELHQQSCLDIIEQFSEVRSLKLVGQPQWVIRVLTKVLYVGMKLDQLILCVPGIGSLYGLLNCITSLSSLRRLSIYANESEENIKIRVLSLTETEIEYFRLDSCSSISWNELSYMLPFLSNIRFLDITLSHDNKHSFSWFSFPKLCFISLKIVEIPFEWIIQIVKTMPSLIKLKLNGLIDVEGFVINHKWLNLFESCPTLNTVTVNLSLEQDVNFFPIDIVETSLHEVNLNLISIDDGCRYFSDGRNQRRWWILSGIITK